MVGTGRAIPFILILLVVNSAISGCISESLPKETATKEPQTCQKTNSMKPLNLSDFLEDQWINMTLRRLYLGQTTDGGFLDDPILIQPYIDSTYYFISALSLINESPHNKERTIKWLHLNENNFFQNVSKYPDELGGIYFGVMSLKLLNETPHNRNEIIKRVLSYRQKNGKFTCNGMDCTWMALKTLVALNYTKAGNWTLEEWYSLRPPERYNFKQVVEYISSFYHTVETLEMMGIDYKMLKTYEEKKDFIQNISQDLISHLNPRAPLFYVAYVAGVLNKTGLLDSESRDIIYRTLEERKLDDGGYHIFGDNYGEHQGTYFAIMALIMIGEEPDRDTLEFIHNRESPFGGFIFPQKLKTNPIETYKTVYILKTLGGDIDRIKLKDYLDKELSRANDPKTLWSIYDSYKLAGIELDKNKWEYFRNMTVFLLEKYLKNPDIITNDPVHMEHFILLLDLGKKLNVIVENGTRRDIADRLLEYREKDGSFKHNLEFTAYSVILLNELGYEYCDQKTIAWLQNQQTEGGWGAPDLYSTELVIEALTSMGAVPRDIDGLLKFLKDIQCPYGEFDMSYGSKNSYVCGDSYATYLALRILEMLSLHDQSSKLL